MYLSTLTFRAHTTLPRLKYESGAEFLLPNKLTREVLFNGPAVLIFPDHLAKLHVDKVISGVDTGVGITPQPIRKIELGSLSSLR